MATACVELLKASAVENSLTNSLFYNMAVDEIIFRRPATSAHK